MIQKIPDFLYPAQKSSSFSIPTHGTVYSMVKQVAAPRPISFKLREYGYSESNITVGTLTTISIYGGNIEKTTIDNTDCSAVMLLFKLR